MTISELTAQLAEIQKLYGDVEVRFPVTHKEHGGSFTTTTPIKTVSTEDTDGYFGKMPMFVLLSH